MTECCSELADISDLRGKLERYLSLMLENAKGDSWDLERLKEELAKLKELDGEAHTKAHCRLS